MQDALKRASTVIQFVCLGLSVLGLLVLVYKVIRSYTKVRMSCLVCTAGNVALMAIHMLYLFEGRPKNVWGQWYWAGYFFFTATYSSVLCSCLLELGHRFYPEGKWSTKLFKLLCGILAITNLMTVAAIISFLINGSVERPLPLATVYLASTILYSSAGSGSFWYAFSPVLIGRSERRVNPRSAGVAIYYMVCVGAVAFVSVGSHVVTEACGGPLGDWWFVTSAADIASRIAVTLVIAFPAPESAINFFKRQLYRNDAVAKSIRERGVVSTGIFPGSTSY